MARAAPGSAPCHGKRATRVPRGRQLEECSTLSRYLGPRLEREARSSVRPLGPDATATCSMPGRGAVGQRGTVTRAGGESGGGRAKGGSRQSGRPGAARAGNGRAPAVGATARPLREVAMQSLFRESDAPGDLLELRAYTSRLLGRDPSPGALHGGGNTSVKLRVPISRTRRRAGNTCGGCAWPRGFRCPRCGHAETYPIRDRGGSSSVGHAAIRPRSRPARSSTGRECPCEPGFWRSSSWPATRRGSRRSSSSAIRGWAATRRPGRCSTSSAPLSAIGPSSASPASSRPMKSMWEGPPRAANEGGEPRTRPWSPGRSSVARTRRAPFVSPWCPAPQGRSSEPSFGA